MNYGQEVVCSLYVACEMLGTVCFLRMHCAGVEVECDSGPPDELLRSSEPRSLDVATRVVKFNDMPSCSIDYCHIFGLFVVGHTLRRIFK